MLMMLDYGIYFEFVPMSEWDSESPRALELRELEVGEEYVLVISTNAGLWRYALGEWYALRRRTRSACRWLGVPHRI